MKTENKKEYFKKLRENWKQAKIMAESKKDSLMAIIKTHGLNISATGFMFVSMQLRQQGLDGLPYLDAKTYQGWKQNGFQVKKGEKSTISGITWINADKGRIDKGHTNNTGQFVTDESVSAESYVFPKEYHLFHKSQVEPIQ